MANDVTNAIACYNLALLFNPKNPAALVNIASAKAQIGRNQEALKDYGKAIENGKTDALLSLAYMGRARVRQALFDDVGAIEDFTKLLKMGPCADGFRINALYGRGYSFGEQADYVHALADYNECIRLEPMNVGAHFNRGRINAELIPNGDLNQATDDFCLVIRMDQRMAGAYYYLGSIHHKLGANRIAVAYLTDSIRLDPSCAPAYHLRGNAFEELGAPKAALADYDRCVSLLPNYDGIYHDRGLLKSKLRDRSAINDLSRAVSLNPNDHRNFAARGYEWWDRMKYSLALADFERALKLNPKDAGSLFGRSAMRFRRGDKRGAQEDLRQLLKLDPSRKDYIESLLAEQAFKNPSPN